jgi:GMP reductase
MKIDYTPQLDFNNVLIRPKRTIITSRSQVNLVRKIKFAHAKYEWEGVPVIAANMDTTGTFEVYDVLSKHRMITCFNKFYTTKDFKDRMSNAILDPDYFMISTGISESGMNNLYEMVDVTNAKWICVDVANGYMEQVIQYCKKLRVVFPNNIIVAGNIATREMAEALIINGKVDVVKIGIGPGSACLTRQKTGVGVPQLSAIMDCADAAHGVNGHIIGDGGITCPGDMSKAFGGGADFVMMGGQFAGHDENPGEVEEIDGKKFKVFYGMSSEHAMKKHYGQMAKYRSSEGRIIKIPYKGSLTNTVLDYLGGVRSTCAYINANTIKNMPKCTTFILASQQLNTHFV